MYQALYRKWRPNTFSDMVGQEHITRTILRQVQLGRMSHAYLFTGTRGTGKTTCAKVLSKAVNCENLQEGNPCNVCPSCLGIDQGAILDVLELDAASNNGVDQVRSLRDEAVYSPGSVKKRVYIIDEVHMLTDQAENALLKILEEPPEHLLFILATTEQHKVLATIRSRCQQFTFKRILPQDISHRLSFVAQQEGIPLAPEGAQLLARLADGGLRDALSLLDQCRHSEQIDESHILDVLGLAGNLDTSKMMLSLGKRETESALLQLGQLYENGRDIGSILGELSALTRDLLLLKTAPNHGTALLTGGYDQQTLDELLALFPTAHLLYALSVLQDTMAKRHNLRRTDGELCLLRLCEPSLEDSTLALSARIARLETGAPPMAQQAPPMAQQAPPMAQQAPPMAQQAPPMAQQATPMAQQAPPMAQQAPPMAQQAPPMAQQAPPMAQQAPPMAQQAPVHDFYDDCYFCDEPPPELNDDIIPDGIFAYYEADYTIPQETYFPTNAQSPIGQQGQQAEPFPQVGQQGQQAEPFPQVGQQGQQAEPFPQVGQQGQQAEPFPQVGQQAEPFPPVGHQGQQAQPFPQVGQQGQQAEPFPQVGQQGQQAQPFPQVGQQGQQAQPFPQVGQQGQQAQPFPQVGQQGQQAQPFPQVGQQGQQAPSQSGQTPTEAQPLTQSTIMEAGSFWLNFMDKLKGRIPPSAWPYIIEQPPKVVGRHSQEGVVLWTSTDFVKKRMEAPGVMEAIETVAKEFFGDSIRVTLKSGIAPPEIPNSAPPMVSQAPSQAEPMVSQAPSQAESMVPQAPSQAEPMVSQAPSQAEPMVSQAPSQAEPMVSQAPSQAEPMVSQAPSQAEPMVSQAPSQAEPMVSQAPSQAESMVPQAPSQAEPMLSQAPSQAEPMLSQAPSQAEPMVPQAPSQAEPMVSQAPSQAEPMVPQTPSGTQEQQGSENVEETVGEDDPLEDLLALENLFNQ